MNKTQTVASPMEFHYSTFSLEPATANYPAVQARQTGVNKGDATLEDRSEDAALQDAALQDALVVGHIGPRDVYNASEILPGPAYTGNATGIALSAHSQFNQTVGAMPLQWPTAPYQQLDQSSSSLPISLDHHNLAQGNAVPPPGQLQGKAFVTLQSEAGGIVIFRVSQEVAAMLIQHQRFIENHV